MKYFVLSFFMSAVCALVAMLSFSRLSSQDWIKYEGIKNFNYSVGSLEEDRESISFTEEKYFNASDIKNINVEVLSADLHFMPSESDKVHVKLDYMGSVENKIFIEVEDKTLRIKHKNKESSTNLKYKDSQIVVHIPAQVAFDVSLNVLAGSVKAEAIKFKNLDLDLAAGDARFESSFFEDADLEVAAGQVKVLKASVKGQLSIEAAAGDIEVELTDSAPRADVKAAAGKVEFRIKSGAKPNYTLKAHASLGKVEVKGDYKKEQNHYIFGNGLGKVQIDAGLGKIEVN